MEDSKGKKIIKTIGKIIFRIVYVVVGLFIIFEAVIGILNMQRLNEDKEPIWYINKKEEVTKFKSETTYNLGLYRIVKTKEGTEKRTELKPFFLK